MMQNNARVCILTDSTAQFTFSSFPGQELVRIIPSHVELEHNLHPYSNDLSITDLPETARDGNVPVLHPPSTEAFRKNYLSLRNKYQDIITILSSSNLSPAYSYAQQASESLLGPDSHSLIDSQTTDVGLGWLVQAAAEAAHNGDSISAIKRLIRNLSSRIYTVFCVQNLTYLHRTGHLESAQAIIGEMLGLIPLFTLEKGTLIPTRKARNMRHLIDLLEEFVSEFTSIKQVALLRGTISFEQEARLLRGHIHNNFPATSYSEHTLGTPLAILFGPRCLGMAVMEAV